MARAVLKRGDKYRSFAKIGAAAFLLPQLMSATVSGFGEAFNDG
jgi:hypothetical protein